MTNKMNTWSRRDFLKTAGMAGAGAMVAPINSPAEASDKMETIPTRPFGKTGINVPILSFGGSLNTSLSPLLLRQAVKWGVSYWDTANSYMGGNSEKGIGKYMAKYPEDRKKIFLVTKSHAWNLKDMTDDLNSSLESMQTDYIDLFFVHSIHRISDLDDETRIWAERAKSEGKIRLFGFSTHSNMEECMLGAAKLGWIDGIMMTYNYRLMHEDRMKRAVEACVRSGIGLTAMKTQGGGQVNTNTDTELELAGRFLEKGFTDAQAKLMAVWENPDIASICSEMPNTTILMSNAAAAMNRTKLTAHDIKLLRRYAQDSRSDYCTGCRDICESEIKGKAPIGDIMRCLMYSRSYGDRNRALALFDGIPENIRDQMTKIDYASAERRCPQKMAIGRLIQEALRELS